MAPDRRDRYGLQTRTKTFGSVLAGGAASGDTRSLPPSVADADIFRLRIHGDPIEAKRRIGSANLADEGHEAQAYGHSPASTRTPLDSHEEVHVVAAKCSRASESRDWIEGATRPAAHRHGCGRQEKLPAALPRCLGGDRLQVQIVEDRHAHRDDHQLVDRLVHAFD